MENNNPSGFTSSAEGEVGELRPVESVNWYEAVAFCNNLTKLTVGVSVYYNESDTPHSSDDADYKRAVKPQYDWTKKEWSKKGYRLPSSSVNVKYNVVIREGEETPSDWGFLSLP